MTARVKTLLIAWNPSIGQSKQMANLMVFGLVFCTITKKQLIRYTHPHRLGARHTAGYGLYSIPCGCIGSSWR